MSEIPSEAPASGMRSLFDRMTKPNAADLETTARSQMLSRSEIDRLINHLGMAFEHIASKRNDLKVKRTSDDTSWTIHVEMKPMVSSVVVVPNLEM